MIKRVPPEPVFKVSQLQLGVPNYHVRVLASGRYIAASYMHSIRQTQKAERLLANHLAQTVEQLLKSKTEQGAATLSAHPARPSRYEGIFERLLKQVAASLSTHVPRAYKGSFTSAIARMY